ncbi:MAG: DUF2339 domain-containing protein [Saprospiraceae bacterium]|nr:DUF2339 domain-containing protein [Saprospiraceae bacterium]
MDTANEKMRQLHEKLELLLSRQDEFSKEINLLRDEINLLKAVGSQQAMTPPPQPVQEPPVEPAPAIAQQAAPAPLRHTVAPAVRPPKEKSNLEKFIGENLINKIGIAITVIGVAVGVKYSIDRDLISPLTRIILGYLMGVGLLGFGYRLKAKYENFSAVLVSGAMAILYFTTYAAYGFFDLLPKMAAFALMVIITVFTVFAAITYNRQVIAHIGLVGAYAVPFLLDDKTGDIATLFSYTAIINAGILALSFRRYWKSLYYASFGLTWLIFLSWFFVKYPSIDQFTTALTFACIFFPIFYITFLAYKLIRKEKFNVDDVLLLLANSFLFFGIGYATLDTHPTGKNLLGLFTLGNALLHFVVAAVIYRQKLADRNLFYLVSGLVLIFITIAIPVQLDGNWVTLLWVGEAALLFWIGRTKNAPVYETLSYPLMALALFSIMHDWETLYASYNPENPDTKITPLLNVNFLSSLLFTGAFGFINYIHQRKDYLSEASPGKGFRGLISLAIPAIFIAAIYFAFRVEISNYWTQLYRGSAVPITEDNYTYQKWNHDYNWFKTVWMINYSLFFFSILSFVNIRKIKNETLGMVNLVLLLLSMLVFLFAGLYAVSELRDSYLGPAFADNQQGTIFHIGIRYVSLAFFGLAWAACFQYVRQDFIRQNLRMAFEILLCISMVWVASSELIHWMNMAHSTQSYKLGLSILWGVSSLALIALGIWQKKKHLRVGAIVLFGLTLAKLFFYDISHLDTISKTIVLVSLGVLLLIISFLYAKYKNLIFEDSKPED